MKGFQVIRWKQRIIIHLFRFTLGLHMQWGKRMVHITIRTGGKDWSPYTETNIYVRFGQRVKDWFDTVGKPFGCRPVWRIDVESQHIVMLAFRLRHLPGISYTDTDDGDSSYFATGKILFLKHTVIM